jgi:hypothetical protein
MNQNFICSELRLSSIVKTLKCVIKSIIIVHHHSMKAQDYVYSFRAVGSWYCLVEKVSNAVSSSSEVKSFVSIVIFSVLLEDLLGEIAS